MIATLLPLFAGLALVLPRQADPQAEPPREEAPAAESLPSSDELEMHLYRPRFTTTRELFNAGARMFRRELTVRDAVTGQQRTLDTLQEIGDTLLVYDLKEPAERAIRMLTWVDEQFDEPENQSVSREYRPRFLSMRSVVDALEVYTRKRGSTQLSILKDDGILLVHDTPEKLDEIFEYLGRLDVARPQVLISCYLVTGASEATSQGLPQELVDGMRDLVGMPGLRMMGRGMLRSSISTDGPQSIVLSEEGVRIYELSLAPAAYDEGSGILSVDRCRLREILTTSDTPRDLFQTQTSVRVGEYTVLGATGSDPMFLVLHVQLFES